MPVQIYDSLNGYAEAVIQLSFSLSSFFGGEGGILV
jgi:hypothetical protein